VFRVARPVTHPDPLPLPSDLLLEAATTTDAPLTSSGLIGHSKALLDISAVIDKVAPADIAVCVYGEPGSGKNLVSRSIHDGSQRRNRPFLTLECAAGTDIVERRLFGHVGATSESLPESESLLVKAHCGTLVLDELTALGAAQQAKLLSAIREGAFRTVRGTDPIHSDVRLITTMTRDPKRAVEEGLLREDLYYRVAVVLIRVPPLRERREDIPLLIDSFLRRFSRAHGKRFSGVVPEVLARMIQHPWLGNIRELEGLLAVACDRAQGEMLTEQDLLPTYQRATMNV